MTYGTSDGQTVFNGGQVGRETSQPVVRKESSDVLLSSSPIASSSKPPPLQQAPPPPTISNAGSVEDNKLVKQTYSVYTKLPGDSESRPMRKWHLTAYYTPHAVHSGQLKDITQIPLLANLQVPPNRFKAARIGKRPGATGSENQLPVSGGGPGAPGTTTTSMYASVSPTGEYIAYGDPHHHHHHPHLMGPGAATLEPSRYPPPVLALASSETWGHIADDVSAGPPSAFVLADGGWGFVSVITAGFVVGGRASYAPDPWQPSQYPHPPPGGGATYPPQPGSYPQPPSSQPQYHPYHQAQYSPAPSYPPLRTSSPLVMSSSPRARISSLPSLTSSHGPYSHTLAPLPGGRYPPPPAAYESQVPQYPPAPKPYDDLPHSPAESVHSDFGGAQDVQMHDASSVGPNPPTGLTTIAENRALPPLDISASFQARTAEDERTLWALTKGFGKERK
ncbi:hypothetical protein FRC01_011143 [Tulasnella sp. 417]|nr:hypothetical protein FRC01_011143 [Tulasnella sp. 417]